MGVTDDFKPRPELPYMTAGEAATFKTLRDSGVVTWFRTAICEGCESEVPKNKRFCGRKCYERVTNGQGNGETGEYGEVD